MSKPIRVLHVVTHMNRGGLETMLMNYYRNINRDKVQFDFLVHRDYRADYDDEIKKLGGRIYRLPRLIPWSWFYRKNLNKFFRVHTEYKIIHVHQDCLSSIILKAAKKYKVPVRIAHSHAASQDKNLKYLIKLFYMRSIPRYATDLFACGEDAGKWMFRGKKFLILNNAIPAKQYLFNQEKRNNIRQQLNLDKKFVVGLVGRFSPQKNHSFLLKVFHELVQIEPNSKLLLVGDGELKREIQSEIEKFYLKDKVLLLGVRNDVPDLLQAMDAFVMTSNYEGLSLAIIEAQSSGLPCFISDKVSIECKKTELVQQISLEDSPKRWAKEILKVKKEVRKNRYQEIAKAGYDIEKNVEFLEDYYFQKINGVLQHEFNKKNNSNFE